jgi:ankyrin repeat protein
LLKNPHCPLVGRNWTLIFTLISKTFFSRFAAKFGHDLLVDFLIRKGANLNDLESQRWTALAFAVDAGQGHVVRRLLEAGADPDIATLDGPLPIDMADSRSGLSAF